MCALLVILAGWLPAAQQAPALPEPAPQSLQEPLDDDLRRRDQPSEHLAAEGRGALGWLLDWGGARSTLEQAGLAIEALWTTDGSWAVADEPFDGTALRSLMDLIFTYDTEPVLGLRGGTVHVGLQWIGGVDASTRFGLLQAHSNIDADRRLQVARVWYEQHFAASASTLRLGKIDANSLFAYVDSGGSFLHSSMGFSPTILPMTTYPDAAFGAALVQGLGAGLEVRAGVFDGSGLGGARTGLRGPSALFESPGDLFLIGELDYAWGSGPAGRLGLGAWSFEGDVARFDGGSDDGASGLFATLDQRLWSAAHDPRRTVAGFLQLGLADEAVCPFTSHLGLGAVWSEAFTSLSDDRAGLGLSRVTLSGEPGAGFGRHDETAIELFLGYEVLPWMRLHHDLQYVLHPGGDASRNAAWIATLRLTAGL